MISPFRKEGQPGDRGLDSQPWNFGVVGPDWQERVKQAVEILVSTELHPSQGFCLNGIFNLGQLSVFVRIRKKATFLGGWTAKHASFSRWMSTWARLHNVVGDFGPVTFLNTGIFGRCRNCIIVHVNPAWIGIGKRSRILLYYGDSNNNNNNNGDTVFMRIKRDWYNIIWLILIWYIVPGTY